MNFYFLQQLRNIIFLVAKKPIISFNPKPKHIEAKGVAETISAMLNHLSKK